MRQCNDLKGSVSIVAWHGKYKLHGRLKMSNCLAVCLVRWMHTGPWNSWPGRRVFFCWLVIRYIILYKVRQETSEATQKSKRTAALFVVRFPNRSTVAATTVPHLWTSTDLGRGKSKYSTTLQNTNRKYENASTTLLQQQQSHKEMCNVWRCKRVNLRWADEKP